MWVWQDSLRGCVEECLSLSHTHTSLCSSITASLQGDSSHSGIQPHSNNPSTPSSCPFSHSPGYSRSSSSSSCTSFHLPTLSPLTVPYALLPTPFFLPTLSSPNTISSLPSLLPTLSPPYSLPLPTLSLPYSLSLLLSRLPTLSLSPYSFSPPDIFYSLLPTFPFFYSLCPPCYVSPNLSSLLSLFLCLSSPLASCVLGL